MALNILYDNHQKWGIGLRGLTQEGYSIAGRLIDLM